MLKSFNLSPPAILALSFAILILIGSFMLFLPFTHHGNLSYLDSLFTAASAVCVTGLIVVDTGTKFTLWGQIIILLLIQVGGLGLMTFSTVILLLLGKPPSLKGRLVLQDILTHSPTKDLLSLVKEVILFTLIVELIGATVLTFHWKDIFPWSKAIFYGIFHAISAFCNAGFSLFSSSFEPFRTDYVLLLTIAVLLILGGIGFLVVTECLFRLQQRKKHLSLHTKLTLITVFCLIIFGTIFLFIFENKNSLKGLSLSYKLLNAFFQAVTPRTAGFNSLHIASLTDASLVLLMLLMFIGASPGSCGGGIKTTTFAVFVSFVRNKLEGKERVHVLSRTLPDETVYRAIVLFALSSFLIFLTTIFLLSTQCYGLPHKAGILSSYLFEAISALGTVGLSTGVTSTLNNWGKIMIICLMFIGRVGPLTVVHFVKAKEVAKRYQYAEENVMIG
ncbi:MAG TPA: hypothetical protein ENF30_01440 [Candidatus Desulfofervidus auxilii]|uniref:ATPase n=1 Tax=Desulfofervidus auxilii TaxID=1621989 RepID=A0A7V0IA57_DESA2|nr:hypothetical protein [Candidatus Desulfofervidus auxilii]